MVGSFIEIKTTGNGMSLGQEIKSSILEILCMNYLLDVKISARQLARQVWYFMGH